MGKKLFEKQGCNCEFEEIPNNIKDSKVKGYKKVIECDTCKNKRISNKEISDAKRLEQERLNQEIEAKKQTAIEKLEKLGLSKEEIDALLK